MNAFEITKGKPTVRLSYTFAAGPLAGVTLTGGVIEDHPEHGTVVAFDYYVNAKALAGKIKRGQGAMTVVAGKPDLEALVAEARAALAVAKGEWEAAAAALEPIGFAVEHGCDAPSSYRYLWPDGADWSLVEARQARGDLMPAEHVRARMSPDDWKRIAEETAAEHLPANLATYGGWKFGPSGLARILALATGRKAEADAVKTKKAAERATAEAARRARFADLDCTVVRAGKTRGEEWDPYALVEVRSKATGEPSGSTAATSSISATS